MRGFSSLFTAEDKADVLDEIRQHREEIYEHLSAIQNLVENVGNSDITARMDAYWLPTINGALGSEEYPNTIMTSLEDTIEEIKEGK